MECEPRYQRLRFRECSRSSVLVCSGESAGAEWRVAGDAGVAHAPPHRPPPRPVGPPPPRNPGRAPRALWWPPRGWAVSYERGTPVVPGKAHAPAVPSCGKQILFAGDAGVAHAPPHRPPPRLVLPPPARTCLCVSPDWHRHRGRAYGRALRSG